MTREIRYNRQALSIGAALFICSAVTSHAEDISPECRGVAAGVVAAMKSSGEINSNEAAEAAIISARRACAAALGGGLEPAPSTASKAKAVDNNQVAAEPAASSQPNSDEKGSSVWDFFTQDRKTKDGHDRLRRLKTQ